MTAVCLEKLLFNWAQVVSIMQEHQADFLGLRGMVFQFWLPVFIAVGQLFGLANFLPALVC